LSPKETKKGRGKERKKERRKKTIQRQRTTCVTCQRGIMDKIRWTSWKYPWKRRLRQM